MLVFSGFWFLFNALFDVFAYPYFRMGLVQRNRRLGSEGTSNGILLLAWPQ